MNGIPIHAGPVEPINVAFFRHCDSQDWSVVLTDEQIDKLSPMTMTNILSYCLHVHTRNPNDPRLGQLVAYCRPLLQKLNQITNNI